MTSGSLTKATGNSSTGATNGDGEGKKRTTMTISVLTSLLVYDKFFMSPFHVWSHFILTTLWCKFLDYKGIKEKTELKTNTLTLKPEFVIDRVVIQCLHST